MRGRRLPGELGLRGHGRLAAVVPHPGDVVLLIESGWRGVRSFSPLRSLLPDVAEKAEHQGDRHGRCVQPTHSRAAFACSTLTAAARRTCVAPRAPDAAAPVARLHRAAESKPCMRASGTRHATVREVEVQTQ